MTWRACRARLTVSSAAGLGATSPVNDSETSRRAERTVRIRARSRAEAASSPDAARARPVGALLVDDAAIDEPGQRRVERREVIQRETILGVVGVQEVEGVFEVDVMGVPHADRSKGVCIHLANHNRPIDRLRARGYITQVTETTYETGYDHTEGAVAMSVLVIIALLIIMLGALDAAALTWGADSRDQLPDDHRR